MPIGGWVLDRSFVPRGRRERGRPCDRRVGDRSWLGRWGSTRSRRASRPSIRRRCSPTSSAATPRASTLLTCSRRTRRRSCSASRAACFIGGDGSTGSATSARGHAHRALPLRRVRRQRLDRGRGDQRGARVRLPARARRGRPGGSAGHLDPAPLPRGRLRALADHEPRPADRARGQDTAASSTTTSRAAAGSTSSARSAAARPASRCAWPRRCCASAARWRSSGAPSCSPASAPPTRMARRTPTSACSSCSGAWTSWCWRTSRSRSRTSGGSSSSTR